MRKKIIVVMPGVDATAESSARPNWVTEHFAFPPHDTRRKNRCAIAINLDGLYPEWQAR
jgi:hypothetical protein